MWIGLLLAFAVQAVAMLTTVSLVINMELEAARAQLRLLGRPDSADVGDNLQAPLINTSEDVV